MGRFRFKQTMYVDDAKGGRVKVNAGDEFADGEIHSGCIASCLAVGAVEEIDQVAKANAKRQAADKETAIKAERERAEAAAIEPKQFGPRDPSPAPEPEKMSEPEQKNARKK